VTIQDWQNLITTAGIPTAFLSVIVWMVWKSMRSVAPYLHDAYKRHCDLIEELKVSVQDTKKTNEALSHAANAIEALADEKHKIDVIPHTMAMKEELK
jgi:threonine dehydrogenase-like Zn-dependent dehydrogenase|tara:strand:+ start:1187 stop:1480 length:294 start_codon:yes stop_codon:yes gene_type:complete